MYRNQPFFGPARNVPGIQPQQFQNMRGILPNFLSGGGSAPGAGGFGQMPFFSPQAQVPAAGAGGNWLNQIQGALKAMQTAGPMIKQYGPMVKNIPAMINMMKLMNESDDEEAEDEESEESSGSKKEEPKRKHTKKVNSNHKQRKRNSPEKVEKKREKQRESSNQGVSQPKLYI
ncbi:YqfQ family protein [Halobacillus sp. A1]|uniref:YqfQ family protein n=1 Tax=Halobacillus sp. A1 TaxID=2880262 RepID=UPI0020A62DD5|nr:YqfQ family protein [Halobacillus sp. A1]MCP3030759.1 YqfQ family protein [Halobacillus sp. A1]